jgi:hypothetical protein
MCTSAALVVAVKLMAHCKIFNGRFQNLRSCWDEFATTILPGGFRSGLPSKNSYLRWRSCCHGSRVLDAHEGLKVSLACAEHKLTQIDRRSRNGANWAECRSVG